MEFPSNETKGSLHHTGIATGIWSVHPQRCDLGAYLYFYLPSFSTRTVIYKGLLLPEDIKSFYLDLKDTRVVTRLALVHQRFSTNTFPTWDLAQPFRYMCHNGEINTYRGNVMRMKAREELFENKSFGDNMSHITPMHT